MRTNHHSSWLGTSLIAAVAFIACEPQPDDAAQQPGAMDEPEAVETPGLTEQPDQPPVDATGEVVQQSITVENPMPHAMIVYRVEDGEREELGEVAANEQETFTVEAESGETIELVAEDEAETHEVEETVVASGDSASWTLGG